MQHLSRHQDEYKQFLEEQREEIDAKAKRTTAESKSQVTLKQVLESRSPYPSLLPN